MRPGSVEGVHIRIEHALKLPLIHDEQVIEALPSHTAQKPLTDAALRNTMRCIAPSQRKTPTITLLGGKQKGAWCAAQMA